MVGRAPSGAPVSLQVYDDFDTPGYSLTDYAERWITPYGLGEMAVDDTRNFNGEPRRGPVPDGV